MKYFMDTADTIVEGVGFSLFSATHLAWLAFGAPYKLSFFIFFLILYSFSSHRLAFIEPRDCHVVFGLQKSCLECSFDAFEAAE